MYATMGVGSFIVFTNKLPYNYQLWFVGEQYWILVSLCLLLHCWLLAAAAAATAAAAAAAPANALDRASI